MGMAASLYYTAEMVQALPHDGNKYETVYGELLVTPAPRIAHELVVFRLGQALGNYLDVQSVGQGFAVAADISWGPDILVQPDVFVAAIEELRRSRSWKDVRTLLLVVEVLSPSTTRYDRFTKRRLYQQVGVPLFWVVDVDAREVEVWTPEATFPTVERERIEWWPAGAAEPFTLELATLFRPI
jgi:Uma2 family endonuclease